MRFTSDAGTRAAPCLQFRRRCRCSTYSLTLRIVPCGVGVPALEPGARGSLGGPRQCLRVDILPDVRQFAISNGDGEDPMVLEGPVRGFDSPRSEADDHNPVALRYELGGLWERSFHRFVSLLKQILQSRVPAVRAGQRPVLARNDPLNIFGRQRQQTLLIAAAECRKKILHNLDILLCAHRNLSIALTSDRVRSFYSKLTLSCFSLLERNSRKSIFCSGPVSARQLSHHRYFFRFLSRLDLHTPY